MSVVRRIQIGENHKSAEVLNRPTDDIQTLSGLTLGATFDGFATIPNVRATLSAWGPSVAVGQFSGRNYTYRGGPALASDGSATQVADGTLVVTDNSTNYVERLYSGLVTKNQTGFSPTNIPMAKVTAAGGVITAVEDWRPGFGVDVAYPVQLAVYHNARIVAAATRAIAATVRLIKTEADLALARAQFLLARYRLDGGPSTRASVLSGSTRTGIAYYPKETFPMTAYADGVPRITTAGQVSERASTQLLTNSAMIGAVVGIVGSGGALPSGMSVIGCSAEIIAYGVVSGVEELTIDLYRSGGTPTGSPSLRMVSGLLTIPTMTKAGIVFSMFAHQVSSSGAVSYVLLGNNQRDSGGSTTVGTDTFSAIFSTTALTRVAVWHGSLTAANKLNLTVLPNITGGTPTTSDFRVRLKLKVIQAEQGDSLSDYTTWIRSTAATVDRGVESIIVTPPTRDTTVDLFVQGAAGGRWDRTVANTGALTVAPFSADPAIAEVVTYSGGQYGAWSDRVAVAEGLQPSVWATPPLTSGGTYEIFTDWKGYQYMVQTANGALFDGSKPYALQSASNKTAIQRFEVRSGDVSWIDTVGQNKNRSEFDGGLIAGQHAAFGTAIWSAYSIMVESGSEVPPGDDTWFILGQWHQTPDPGEITKSPIYTFQLLRGGLVQIDVRYDPLAISTVFPPSHVVYTGTVPLERDVYHAIVTKHVFNQTGTGILQVWIDGVQVVNYAGAIGYNDAGLPYFKYGIYRSGATDTAAVRYANMEYGTADLTARITAPLEIA